MHEIGMCEGLVHLIAQRAAGRPVSDVRVRVGVRHAVLDDAFDQAFALVAEGTAAQGAAVDLVITPVTVACRGCDRRSESMDPLAVCAWCRSSDVDISGGEELVLESIRFATPGEPAPVGQPAMVGEAAISSGQPATVRPEDAHVSRHTR